MLFEIFIWAYILFFSYIYGWNIIQMLGKFFRSNSISEFPSIPLVILIGIVGINTFAAILSLFIKLGWLAQLIFLLLGIVLGVRLWKSKEFHFYFKLSSIPKLIILLLFLVFLIVLENGTHPPTNPDTGIYHAQAIRWIETFPAVPGLGNLHTRLAYDSNWLVINAFFSFAFLGIRSFHVLPGAFLLIVLVYLLQGTIHLLKRKVTITDILKTLLIPFIFYTLRNQISSPGTDFPVQVLMGVIICIWVESIEIHKETDRNATNIEELLIFIFSIYLITIKLTALPLLLLASFIFIKQTRKYARNALKLLCLTLIILGPWFARNLILSGYWVFPAPFLVNLSPNWDWKIPVKVVINESKSIRAWARIPGMNSAEVLAMPLFSWMRVWLGNLTSNQRLIFLGAILSPMMFSISALTELRKKTDFLNYGLIYIVFYIGLLFWLVSAPDIRFGYVFMGSTILLAFLPFLVWIVNKIQFRKYLITGLLIFICLFQTKLLVNSIDYKTLESRLLIPADYSSLATVPCSIHGYSLFCAEHYNICGYAPFPCIPPGPGTTNKRSELRGASLADGFRSLDAP